MCASHLGQICILGRQSGKDDAAAAAAGEKGKKVAAAAAGRNKRETKVERKIVRTKYIVITMNME
jgi:hypothetical protein